MLIVYSNLAAGALAWGFRLMLLANVSLMFQDVDALSDEQGDGPAAKVAVEKKKPGRKPAQATETRTGTSEPHKPVKGKKPASLKAKGKPKAEGKPGRPKGKAKAAPKTKKVANEETSEKEEKSDNGEAKSDKASETENTGKGERKSALKRPAASAPMKRPSANAPLRVWKYQYGSGVYGFKNSRLNKEVLRVGWVSKCFKRLHVLQVCLYDVLYMFVCSTIVSIEMAYNGAVQCLFTFLHLYFSPGR